MNFNFTLPVILYVLQQLFELPRLNSEEKDEAGDEEEEGIDPALERDQERGRGDEVRRQAVRYDVGQRQREAQCLH